MGMKLNINNILRLDVTHELKVGEEYPFEKSLSYLGDDIQIWLTKRDWTPLAEITITSQTRKDGKTTGTYKVEYVYTQEEQEVLGEIFKRMYGWVERE